MNDVSPIQDVSISVIAALKAILLGPNLSSALAERVKAGKYPVVIFGVEAVNPRLYSIL
jgi:hypothetical protein